MVVLEAVQIFAGGYRGIHDISSGCCFHSRHAFHACLADYHHSALRASVRVAELGGWLDLDGLHYCAAERRSAFLRGDYRSVYLQDVHGNQAPSALYH